MLEEICKHLKCSDRAHPAPPQADHADVDADITDIEQVVLMLHESFSLRWESFKDRQPLKDVAQFGSDLQRLGETHHSRLLMNFGQSLQEYVERFDIENMRKTL